ncbi:MAG: lipoate--protein ligase family protein [Acidimicrobiia bacterium]|nr:lipoate--protein ligase family protein [Acidimicrobiia bacterium]
MRPVAGAVVLGSGQRPGTVDAAAARQRNLPILRRRSGGGVVLVSPVDLLWVDVVIPRDDPLWHPDAGRAFVWLGRAWQRALAECGIAGEVHEGAYEAGRWGSLVCYAGRGPGEVFVEGRKVVGLSQRRSRTCARFQSGLLRRWDPAELADLCALAQPERRALARDLAESAAGVAVAEDRMLGALSVALTTRE